MSTAISSPNMILKIKTRPSTPMKRRCLTSLQCNVRNNINIQQGLLDLIDRLKNSTDSSTQLLIRLYYHKSVRLNDQPEKLYLFQQEIYSGLRRLHPSIIDSSLLKQENQLYIVPQPIITSRSAQATIRKLH
ncbi:unnamed protein product [Rotaria sordida]|uniref:Uncharacterized protein n=1 Tax=Rotaria sordida TaxID=392033 RepID=A0A814ARV3_9BILA|nr:unnamed protein product [Rotaria sordida]CAF1374833.1 unnamed protein product [Rotaria sordida]CAF3507819.1 unnamed protein product [Rotaria sordida]CAF3558605.1 unnamed protein product [Rotaria sordida]